jgi:hypothetical protein
MQVNLYALLIEKNTELLSNILQVGSTAQLSGAQIVYFTEKDPVRCAVKLNRDSAMAFLKSALARLIAVDLPPVLSDVDELWRCDYCPVRTACEQLHGKPVGKVGLES